MATAAQRDAVRARLADVHPGPRRPALVPSFVAHDRGGLPTPGPGELDTLDPADHGPEVLATSARQTHDAVKLLVEALCL